MAKSKPAAASSAKAAGGKKTSTEAPATMPAPAKKMAAKKTKGKDC